MFISRPSQGCQYITRQLGRLVQQRGSEFRTDAVIRKIRQRAQNAFRILYFIYPLVSASAELDLTAATDA